MTQFLSEAVVVVACSLMLVLSVEAIGVMRRKGSWVAFVTWSGVGLAALAVGVQWRDLPPPVAWLLAVLSSMIWTQRRRIVWSIKQGKMW